MRSPHHFFRVVGGGLCLLVSTLITLAAEDKAAKNASDVVDLPTFEVTDRRLLPPPDSWSYAQISGFEVISESSDGETQRLLRDFEMFRMALRIAWPLKLKPMPPSALILCARSGSFEAFLPKRDGETHKDITRQRMGITLVDRERTFLVLDTRSKILTLGSSTRDLAGSVTVPVNTGEFSDLSAETSTGVVDMNIDRNSMLFREYVKYLMTSPDGALPAWYEEGLLQIAAKMEVYPRRITLGRLESISPKDPPTAEEASDGGAPLIPPIPSVYDVDFHTALKRSPLLSFQDFFGVARDSEALRNPYGLWAKQSYAFVHMCLFRMGKPYQKAFESFVQRAVKEPVTEALFEECFGRRYDAFLVELRGYVDLTDYRYEEINITGKETLEYDPPEMRLATEGEWTRIKGDALHAAGRDSLARETLVAAYIRGERDPEFLATFGLIEKAAGNLERAEKFLAAAAAGKSRRGSVYVELGRLRLDRAIAEPAGADRQISGEQLAPVLDALLAARTLPPVQPKLYELIAAAWLHCENVPKPADFVVLSEGLKKFPRDRELIYDTTVLAARAQFHDATRALVNYGIRTARTEKERARYAKLQERLPAPSSVR
jgi:hypothetical protein